MNRQTKLSYVKAIISNWGSEDKSSNTIEMRWTVCPLLSSLVTKPTRYPRSKARRYNSWTLQQPSTAFLSGLWAWHLLLFSVQIMAKKWETRNAGLLQCPRILLMCFRARISEADFPFIRRPNVRCDPSCQRKQTRFCSPPLLPSCVRDCPAQRQGVQKVGRICQL